MSFDECLEYRLNCSFLKTHFVNDRYKQITSLIHWGWVTHVCVSKLTIIGSDNGLSPGRRQAIIWTNAGILLTGPLGTNFSEILIEFYTFLAATKQLYEWFSPSVSPSVCLSVCLSVTPFSLCSHHRIIMSYSYWHKWYPCKMSTSEVKGQGHRDQNPL